MSRKSNDLVLKPVVAPDAGLLIIDVQRLIEEARHAAARAVNMGLTQLYWQIGQRIRKDVLGQARAEYGQEILPTLSAELTPRYGRGYSARSLWRMVQFAECFPQESIVSTLSRQLAWSHFQELIGLKDPLARDFYAEMCRVQRWTLAMPSVMPCPHCGRCAAFAAMCCRPTFRRAWGYFLSMRARP
jgi:hypothetical protein